tara:strand:- start:744 stop:1058 length:315 start_codon:yes stop_codon:yes gene_type:complete
MIRFIEIMNETNFNPRMERVSTPRFTVGEVWINEKYVISVREAIGYRALLKEGHLPGDLSEEHQFTTITTHNGTLTETHVVVGSPDIVATRLNKNQARAQLLKG